jgi:hypothetical protein
MSEKREIPKTPHLKTVILLLYDYIYIQFMSMIRDHKLYIAYTCDYKVLLHYVAFIK